MFTRQELIEQPPHTSVTSDLFEQNNSYECESYLSQFIN